MLRVKRHPGTISLRIASSLIVPTALILVSCFFLPQGVNARTHAADTWYFGEGAGLNFCNGKPVSLTESVASSSEGSAVISDQKGNVLFYSDGLYVWDRLHNPMPNGDRLDGSPFSPQSALIIPSPGDSTLYYLFTVAEDSGLEYAVVDMAANNGLGSVVRKHVQLRRPIAEKLTAVHHHNGSDVWVIVMGFDDNAFYAYLVSESGVRATPVISNAGIGHTRCEFDRSGFLKASPDGTKLALSVFETGFFEVFDFNAATGTVSDPVFLGEYESAYGIEFSPDSTKLYATVVSWVHKHIYQFDLEADSIPDSVKVIGETSEEARFRALQVAADGRIYVARENSFYLGVIEYPNQPGPASQYIDKGVFLEGRQCRYGLPNFVQSFFTPPIITLTIQDTQAAEGEMTAEFLVELSEASRSDISVTYRSRDGTAHADSDYHKTTGVLRIPAGSQSAAIHVNIVDDDVFDEGDETIIMTLRNPQRVVLHKGSAVATIRDNDLVGLSIADAAADEGDAALVFPVTLSQASRSEVSVEYTTSDETARAEQDYQAVTGTLTIPAGERSGRIVVPLHDDEVDETDATVRLHLSHPLNADLLASQATGTIRDDDEPPLVTIDDAILVEQTGALTFTVRLSQISQRDVVLTYTTCDDSATAGRDYTATSGTIHIPAGLQRSTIMVDLLDDDRDEAREQFLLTLNKAVNATIHDPQGIGIIKDNDAPPTLSISEASADEADAAMDFLLTLSTVSGREVSLQYATRDATAVAGEDYDAASGTLSIPAGSQAATLRVPLHDDNNYERDEAFALHLAQPQHVTLPEEPTVLGTIRDNDAPPAIRIVDGAADEDAGSVTFQIVLSGASYQDVVVHAVTTDGSATIAGNDYLLRPDAEIRIPAGETHRTISVTINEDTLIEGDEYFFVLLHEPVNASLADDRGRGTILDNDALPVLSINDVVAEHEARVMRFLVSLSEPTELPVIVNYATRGKTAIQGRHYAPISGTLAIAPTRLSGVIEVRLLADMERDGEKVLTVELSEAYNAILADPQGIGAIWKPQEESPTHPQE
jgi:hypothetical protein